MFKRVAQWVRKVRRRKRKRLAKFQTMIAMMDDRRELQDALEDAEFWGEKTTRDLLKQRTEAYHWKRDYEGLEEEFVKLLKQPSEIDAQLRHKLKWACRWRDNWRKRAVERDRRIKELEESQASCERELIILKEEPVQAAQSNT